MLSSSRLTNALSTARLRSAPITARIGSALHGHKRALVYLGTAAVITGSAGAAGAATTSGPAANLPPALLAAAPGPVTATAGQASATSSGLVSGLPSLTKDSLSTPVDLPSANRTAAAAAGGSASATPTATSAAGTPKAASTAAGSPATATPAPGTPGTASSAARTPASATPAPGTPATATPAPGTPGTASSAARTPASATLAPGTPASATPAPGTPGTASSAPASPAPAPAAPPARPSLNTWSNIEDASANQGAGSPVSVWYNPLPVGLSGRQSQMPLGGAQWNNATEIVGEALHKGMGLRSAVIAVATAMQESKLVNISYGTYDSLGLFQQRPSAGWGSPAQVTNPVYSSDAFLNALHLYQLRHPDWATEPVWEPAQGVQDSAYPYAYEQWESQAAQVVMGAARDLLAG